jgi:peptidase M48-like protein
MSNRYLLILVLYALASFGSILAIAEAAAWLLRKQALSVIERLRPQDGVIAHLVLRLLPALLALLLTSLSAVPGYFKGEPIGTHELPGPWLIGLAIVGLYSLIAPLVQVAWLAARTQARTKRWLQTAIGGESFSNFPVIELGLEQPVIVASGVLTKSIWISSAVRSLLSPRELRAALRHEAAHCRQNHNLAKLLCALAPRLLPAKMMEENLRETIEYAADDEACSIPGDGLNLASAVVTLAKQSAAPASSMLYTALVDPRQAARLERRVERLVLPRQLGNSRIFVTLSSACFAMIVCTAAIGSSPLAQHAFRETLELLVR